MAAESHASNNGKGQQQRMRMNVTRGSQNIYNESLALCVGIRVSIGLFVSEFIRIKWWWWWSISSGRVADSHLIKYNKSDKRLVTPMPTN